MTRGKYTQAAAVRHEVQTRDQEIATYQHRVAKLTAEVADLKRSANERGRITAKTERELRARLDLAAAPKVEALELLNADLTRRLETQAARFVRQDEIMQKVFDGIYNRCMADGQTHEDALRSLAELWGWPRVAGDLEARAVRSQQGDHGAASEQLDIERAVRADRVLEARRHGQRITKARYADLARALEVGP